MIRIFIVDEAPGTIRSLEEMLALEKDIKVVGKNPPNSGVRDAVEKAKPHIVLLEGGNIGGDIMDLATSIQATSSHPALIIMSERHDMDLVRRSMMLGARDHLARPFREQDLIGAIRNVFDTSGVGLNAKGKLLGCLGCRGGAGNTTVALSLAGAAVRQGLRVAAVDANLLLGDVAFLLNASTEITWMDWSKDISRGEADPRKYLVRSSEGIDILSAPINPAQAELVKVDSISRMLNALRETHELIVVDIPNNFTEATLEFTECVQELCFVSDPTLTGVKNLRLTWNLVEQLRFPHERRSVVLNRVRKYDKDTVKGITRDYPSLLALPMEGEIEKCWLRGQTPAKQYPRSLFSKSISNLLEHILTPDGED